MTPESFIANFNHLADAPNGVQKLRELILSMAVRGKLVPQDPNDEPATVLLARIKVEKERLVKEKKIRKAEPIPPVSADKAPYELPRGWEWARIGDVVLAITGGGTPSKQNPRYWGGDIPWASVKDLGKGKYLDSTIDHITQMGLSESSSNLIPEGQIIVCTRMGLGKIAINRIAASINQDLKALSLSGNLNIDYFYNYYLTQNIQGSGMTVSDIKQDALLSMTFPLPPLVEQHRIVAKVDQLMALCDEMEERQQRSHTKLTRLNNSALDRLLNAREADAFTTAWRLVRDNFDHLYTTPETITKLRQAILQLAVQGKLVPQDPNDEPASVLLARIKAQKELLVKEKKIRNVEPLSPAAADGVPYELPQGWEVQKFAELADIVGGVAKGRNLAGKRTALYPYLRVANVQRGFLDLAVMKEIEIPLDELEKYKISDGDLLITEGGDWDKVGRTAIWNGEIETCIHQNHVFRARLIVGQLNRNWVMQYINSSLGRRYFEGASKQTTNLASINMTQLRNCPIPIPPTAEQQRIVAKVDKLMDLCDVLEAKLTKSQTKAEKLATAAVKGLIAA